MENSASIPFLRTRLSVQMFLQFAIWGVWVPVLGNHLVQLNFKRDQIGMIYLTGSLALMISPLIAGQIADRWFATQRFMSLSYFASAVFFFWAAKSTDFSTVWWLALLAMIFFGPTLGLANALCFHHLKDGEREFPAIRVWGTVGWIAANWILSYWIEWTQRPIGDCLNIAGVFCIANGLFSLSLPHTPPRKDAREKFAAAQVLAALKNPSFAVFSVLACLLLVFATFYYNLVGIFLNEGAGFENYQVSRITSIGQIMEIMTMLILPAVLARLGMKWTIALGILAWAARFGLFALGKPVSVVYAGQALHGVCFAFAIAGAMIYVERASSPDIRSSMQSFLSFITYGIGMLAGSIVAGQISAKYTVAKVINEKTVDVTDWQQVWMVPAIGCLAVLLVFVFTFNPPKESEPAGEKAIGVS